MRLRHSNAKLKVFERTLYIYIYVCVRGNSKKKETIIREGYEQRRFMLAKYLVNVMGK